MMTLLKSLAIACLCAVTAALGAAPPALSRFVCERPQPWEAGAVTNVSIAAGLIHGRVLAPGEEFSFNDAMEPGLPLFVEGTSYASGRVVTSDGGGICQVSSGLYNAVLLAGLAVVERRTHSLYDPRGAYVQPGRDAMVTRVGKADFRFRNSTARPLTIQAVAEGGRLDISLLGRQRRPRERWIETEEVERRPFELIQELDPELAPGERKLLRRGFDGLAVRRRICWNDAEGQPQCTPLGLDRYMRVHERWKVGPPLPEQAPATPEAGS
jgi:vancomycin resistance protein YoaR